MTDIWRDYMRETYGREVLYWDPGDASGYAGLISYERQGDDLYIADVYVRPVFRKAGVARLLFYRVRDEARRLGCTRILGTVDVTRAGWRESIAAQEAVGFVLTSTNERGQALLVYALNDKGE